MSTGAKLPRGLTIPLTELKERFGKFSQNLNSDEQCVEEIIAIAKFDSKNCKECGSRKVTRILGESVVSCQMCSTETDLFDGTFFDGMQIPFAYLSAFWIRKEQIGISVNRFADLVGIAQSTAVDIFRKLDTVILEALMDEANFADSQIFVEIFSKRSSETPAREEPNKEPVPERPQNGTADEEVPDEVFETGMNGTIPAEDQRKVYRMLSFDSPTSFDSLCDSTGFGPGKVASILTCLETIGLSKALCGDLHQKVARVSGHQKVGSVSGLDKAFAVDKRKLQKFFEHVRHVFHGISRKHLQKFLARYWSFVCAKFHNTDFLIQACAKHRHLSRADICDYVTPAAVKVLFA